MNNACTEYRCFGTDHFGWGSSEAVLFSDAMLYLYVAMGSCDCFLFIVAQGVWHFVILVVVYILILHLPWRIWSA